MMDYQGGGNEWQAKQCASLVIVKVCASFLVFASSSRWFMT